MTSWSIHTFFFVLVDPHPFCCIKIIWINQNKKGCGSTKTSLTVHTVYIYLKLNNPRPEQAPLDLLLTDQANSAFLTYFLALGSRNSE